jgi:hypothetical protein
LTSKLSIKQPKDWGSVTQQEFIANKGVSLLNKYGKSLYRLLKHVYSGSFLTLGDIYDKQI